MLPEGWTRATFASQGRPAGLGVIGSDPFCEAGTPPETVRLSLGDPSTRQQTMQGLEVHAHAFEGSPTLARHTTETVEAQSLGWSSDGFCARTKRIGPRADVKAAVERSPLWVTGGPWPFVQKRTFDGKVAGVVGCSRWFSMAGPTARVRPQVLLGPTWIAAAIASAGPVWDRARGHAGEDPVPADQPVHQSCAEMGEDDPE